MTKYFIMFLKLIMAHALADFSLQTAAMGTFKNRYYHFTEDMKHVPTWQYWMTAHALINVLLVWVVTGVCWLGLVETILHWLIDYIKCENLISAHKDQLLHLFTKIGYLFFI